MSKASEWVKRVGEEPPKFVAPGPGKLAEVDIAGWLTVTHGFTLSPKDALALAEWINDTFGENPNENIVSKEEHECPHCQERF